MEGATKKFKNHQGPFFRPRSIHICQLKPNPSGDPVSLMYENVPVRNTKLKLMPTYFERGGGVGEVIKIGRNIRWYIEESSGSGAH